MKTKKRLADKISEGGKAIAGSRVTKQELAQGNLYMQGRLRNMEAGLGQWKSMVADLEEILAMLQEVLTAKAE